ncbi:uncharacterized protein PGTG_03037 [Puccinia graminis f. sp. tritici CRL 75-36-700-3]|uniref:SLC26A/SulP transporter domain-containing protein n=1 Tax=Puccinia graminis f. sp. tritici (strain CRL 75-36-700-3 / race SCCL) TaxID=418459 RepID=E3JYF6_PUCGT|nr:uncharacterized protein PGTG_03037 [Puccinia graminis f. sp. tritici CRL 75-36-700-3]EFP77081.2 hypothetical protein PGTG_03037 [Puccinia graminis f. sp. tritici CRL 75-36-700-3]
MYPKSNLAGIPSLNGLFSAAIPAIHTAKLTPDFSYQPMPTQSRSLYALLTFPAGLIAFSFGFFRLGFLDALLSKATLLRGFVTAIAVVTAIEQLPSLLALAALEKEQQAINTQGSVEKLIWTLANCPGLKYLPEILSKLRHQSLQLEPKRCRRPRFNINQQTSNRFTVERRLEKTWQRYARYSNHTLCSLMDSIVAAKDPTAMRVRILGRHPITRTWEPIDTKKTESAEVAREIEEEIPGVVRKKDRGDWKCRRAYIQISNLVFQDHLFTLLLPLLILREILQEYIDRLVIIGISHIKPINRYEVFQKAGILSVVGEDQLLAHVNQVLKTAQKATL